VKEVMMITSKIIEKQREELLTRVKPFSYDSSKLNRFNGSPSFVFDSGNEEIRKPQSQLIKNKN